MTMKNSSRLIPIFSSAVGLLVVLLGVQLLNQNLNWLAGYLTQAGVPNPANLEKIRLLPLTLVLTGGETLFLSLLGTAYHKRFSTYLSAAKAKLNKKQRFLLLLLCLYGITTLLALNFSALTLEESLRARHLRDPALAEALREEYAVFDALERQTPVEASILIRTRRELKYLLNYDLYPRRFYFYPNDQTEISQIPDEWMCKHRIEWTLEISDNGPLRFALLPHACARK
jgi:hypothetical protein